MMRWLSRFFGSRDSDQGPPEAERDTLSTLQGDPELLAHMATLGKAVDAWSTAYGALRDAGGRSVPLLIAAIRSPNYFLRLRAIDLLAAIGDPRAIGALTDARRIGGHDFRKMLELGRSEKTVTVDDERLQVDDLLDDYRRRAGEACDKIRKASF